MKQSLCYRKASYGYRKMSRPVVVETSRCSFEIFVGAFLLCLLYCKVDDLNAALQ